MLFCINWLSRRNLASIASSWAEQAAPSASLPWVFRHTSRAALGVRVVEGQHRRPPQQFLRRRRVARMVFEPAQGEQCACMIGMLGKQGIQARAGLGRLVQIAAAQRQAKQDLRVAGLPHAQTFVVRDRFPAPSRALQRLGQGKPGVIQGWRNLDGPAVILQGLVEALQAFLGLASPIIACRVIGPGLQESVEALQGVGQEEAVEVALADGFQDGRGLVGLVFQRRLETLLDAAWIALLSDQQFAFEAGGSRKQLQALIGRQMGIGLIVIIAASGRLRCEQADRGIIAADLQAILQVLLGQVELVGSDGGLGNLQVMPRPQKPGADESTAAQKQHAGGQQEHSLPGHSLLRSMRRRSGFSSFQPSAISYQPYRFASCWFG